MQYTASKAILLNLTFSYLFLLKLKFYVFLFVFYFERVYYLKSNFLIVGNKNETNMGNKQR